MILCSSRFLIRVESEIQELNLATVFSNLEKAKLFFYAQYLVFVNQMGCFKFRDNDRTIDYVTRNLLTHGQYT